MFPGSVGEVSPTAEHKLRARYRVVESPGEAGLDSKRPHMDGWMRGWMDGCMDGWMDGTDSRALWPKGAFPASSVPLCEGKLTLRQDTLLAGRAAAPPASVMLQNRCQVGRRV